MPQPYHRNKLVSQKTMKNGCFVYIPEDPLFKTPDKSNFLILNFRFSGVPNTACLF